MVMCVHEEVVSPVVVLGRVLVMPAICCREIYCNLSPENLTKLWALECLTVDEARK